MKFTSKGRQILMPLLLVAILVLASLAYLQPEFVVDLANRFVLCYVN